MDIFYRNSSRLLQFMGAGMLLTFHIAFIYVKKQKENLKQIFPKVTLLCFFVVKKTLNNLSWNPIFKKKTVNRFVKLVQQFIRGFSQVIFPFIDLGQDSWPFAQLCIEVASFQFLQNQFGSWKGWLKYQVTLHAKGNAWFVTVNIKPLYVHRVLRYVCVNLSNPACNQL